MDPGFTDNGDGTYTYRVPSEKIPEGYEFSRTERRPQATLNAGGSTQVTAYISPILYKVTIDPAEGTMKDEYKETIVQEGDKFTLTYDFTMGLKAEDKTLVGYEVVSGTIKLTEDGEALTRLDTFKKDYIVESDVVLKAIF